MTWNKKLLFIKSAGGEESHIWKWTYQPLQLRWHLFEGETKLQYSMTSCKQKFQL